MKSNYVYAAFIGVLLSVAVSAQPITSKTSSIYVKVYGAYGFLAPGSFKGRSDMVSNEPVNFPLEGLGMGGGVRAGVGIGIILNEFINLGLDGEYLMGTKIKLNQYTTPEESMRAGGSGYTLEAHRTLSHEVISVIPNIVFKAISKPNYYVYNRLGVVVGLPFGMTEDFFLYYHHHNDKGETHTMEDRKKEILYKGKHTLKPAIGYQFSLGVQVVISERLRGFLETSAYNISFDRSKYEDNERLRIEVLKNKDEPQQPTVYDHSRFNFRYINSGPTGTNLKGVPFNQLTTVTYAQDPVIMNAITVGAGLAYRF